MPHDMNGKVIEVGDTVNVPCKVKSIQMTEEYCNLSLETNAPMPPYIVPTTITLNTKQVVLQEK